jgi:FixJ family two-component response regulator
MPIYRIIVVDDEDEVRSIICALALEAVPDATIREYSSGVGALRDVEGGQATLLITNCHMPDMNGPTLVRKIREMKNAIPIIMVSGDPDARLLGEKAGIDKFVEKVHLNSQLVEAIHTCLAEN